jgi:hypothetical protein
VRAAACARGAGCQTYRAARAARGRLTAYSQNGARQFCSPSAPPTAKKIVAATVRRYRREDDLQTEVALALRAVEVVGQQRRAAGHDGRFGEPDEHTAHHDQLQGGQPQRRGADDGVDHQRDDQQALAAQPVDDAAGEGSRQTDHQRRRREDDGRERLDARGAGEGVLDAGQDGRQQHGAEHGQTAREEQDQGLRPAGRTAGGGVDGDLAGEGFPDGPAGAQDVLRHGRLR